MNRRYKKINNSSRIKEIISLHIEKNLKEYIVVSIIFFIGIIIGVIFINKISDNQKTEITSYISNFITDIKDDRNIDEIALLLNSIKNNFLLTIFLWFMGLTILGMFVVYPTICFRGFCLGYTISSIVLTIRNKYGNYIFNF